ncbi:ZP domain-containing protein [Aphelenchoides bicaudatus]|nr:ZP domain-containing protein [Aphelenchoides bicaudatus]
MKLVTDVEHHGKGDGEEISQIDVGKPMRLEFTLEPETDAYGLLIHNCYIRDLVSGHEHEIIDTHGCSTDLNIVAHPYYDTYHDVVRVHTHAFKLPDHTRLSIRCDFQICTEIKDEHNKSSCQEIGTPPFCPDIITSPQNSVLFDGRSNNVRRRARRSMHKFNNSNLIFIDEQTSDTMEQRVHADLCLGNDRDEFCNKEFDAIKEKHMQQRENEDSSVQLEYCLSRYTVAFGTGFTIWTLFIGLGLHFYLFLRTYFDGNFDTK